MTKKANLSAEQQAFVNRFPESVRPPRGWPYTNTTCGREDIQAFIDAGTKIDVPKASASQKVLCRRGWDTINKRIR